MAQDERTVMRAIAARWPDKITIERLDYSVDWSRQMDIGEVIEALNFAAAPAGLEIDAHDIAGAVTTVWIRGGAAEVEYAVDLSVVTSQGRIIATRVYLFVLLDPADPAPSTAPSTLDFSDPLNSGLALLAL